MDEDAGFGLGGWGLRGDGHGGGYLVVGVEVEEREMQKANPYGMASVEWGGLLRGLA